MFILLLLLLTANALVVEFNVHTLKKEYQPEAVASLMHSFDITRLNLEVIAGVLASSPELEYHYYNRDETATRVDELLKYSHLLPLHEKVYGLCKLAAEVRLAEKVLLGHCGYQIDIHKPLQNPHSLKHFKDNEIQRVLLTMMKEQIMEMQDPSNMEMLLKQYITTVDPFASFNEFLPILTPEILAVFLDPKQPHYETFSVLARQYMTESTNADEHVIRNLLVLQACQKILDCLDDSPLADSAMENLHLKATKEVMNLRRLLKNLNAMTSGTNNRADDRADGKVDDRMDICYWSCLATLALKVSTAGWCTESNNAFEIILSRGDAYLPPFYMQLVVAKCARLPGPHWKSLIQSLNPTYLPLNLRSIEEKRTLWLDMGVMQMVHMDTTMSEDKCESYLLKKLSKGYLPTNISCSTFDGKVRNISDWTIIRAENLIEDIFMYDPISTTTMSIIVASWAYLILDDKKLDFGSLFSDVSSWREFKVKMQYWSGGGSAAVANSIIERARSIGLVQVFTPQDIKLLVELENNHDI